MKAGFKPRSSTVMRILPWSPAIRALYLLFPAP